MTIESNQQKPRVTGILGDSLGKVRTGREEFTAIQEQHYNELRSQGLSEMEATIVAKKGRKRR